MVDFLLAPAVWYYSTGIGPTYVGMFFAGTGLLFLITRPISMFVIYVKTGTINHGHFDTFMDNLGDAIVHFGDWSRVKKLVSDLFIGTVPEDLMYDCIMFLFVGLGALMIGGLIPYILVVWAVVYGIIRLAKYLRRRVEIREEFIAKLKGER